MARKKDKLCGTGEVSGKGRFFILEFDDGKDLCGMRVRKKKKKKGGEVMWI